MRFLARPFSLFRRAPVDTESAPQQPVILKPARVEPTAEEKAQSIQSLKEQWRALADSLTLIKLDDFTDKEWRAIETFRRDPTDPAARRDMPRFVGDFTADAQNEFMRLAYKNPAESMGYSPPYNALQHLYILEQSEHLAEEVDLLKRVRDEWMPIENIIFGFNLTAENYDALQIQAGEFVQQKTPYLHVDYAFSRGQRGFLLSRIGDCAPWTMAHDAELFATAEQKDLIKLAGLRDLPEGIKAIEQLKEQKLLSEVPLGKIAVQLYNDFHEETQTALPGTAHVSGSIRPQPGRLGSFSAFVRG